MKKALLGLALLILLPGWPLLAGDKKIALTFDDLPYFKPLGFWRPREVSNQILRALETENIPAAGFVVQEKVEDDPSSYVVLDDWAARGHLLGNQTWGDVDFNEVGVEDFIEHAVDGQKYLKRLGRAHDFNFRYLRFPQLHEGNHPRKKKQVRKRLYRANYRIAHVSVKTSDWAFNHVYLERVGQPQELQKIERLYLEHVLGSLDYSERQSQAVFGRNISHVLQLRPGIATAHILPSLIERLRERGYEFVRLEEALSDKAYETEEDYVGPLGLTFIDRVAVTRGLPIDEEVGELTREAVERMLGSRSSSMDSNTTAQRYSASR